MRAATAFAGENRAERQAGGQRLGDHDDVRLRGKFLVREVAAGAAEAALNFVGDQQGAVLRGECARALPECFADRIDAAFALNRFQDDGANGVVEFRFEVRDVVERDEFDAGNERREGQRDIFRWR